MKPLWHPDEQRIDQANITHFMEWLTAREKSTFTDYTQLYDWSLCA